MEHILCEYRSYNPIYTKIEHDEKDVRIRHHYELEF